MQGRSFVILSLILLLAAAACSERPNKVKVSPISSEQFIQELKVAGFEIQSIRSSKKTALFERGKQGLWLKTSRGIIEVIFFDRIKDANKVSIEPVSDAPEGRYHYELRERPRLPEKLIDANRPLFIETYKNALMVTDKPGLLGDLTTQLNSH